MFYIFIHFISKWSKKQCSLHIKLNWATNFMENGESKTVSQIFFNIMCSGLTQLKTQKYWICKHLSLSFHQQACLWSYQCRYRLTPLSCHAQCGLKLVAIFTFVTFFFSFFFLFIMPNKSFLTTSWLNAFLLLTLSLLNLICIWLNSNILYN